MFYSSKNLTLCAPSVRLGNNGLGGMYSATLKPNKKHSFPLQGLLQGEIVQSMPIIPLFKRFQPMAYFSKFKNILH